MLDYPLKKGFKIVNVPNLRFPEFTGEWRKDIFENVCSITTGNKNTQDKSDDGIYLLLFYLSVEGDVSLKHKRERNLVLCIGSEAERAAVEAHYLAREAQADPRAVLFGREEGCEDVFGDPGGDSAPVVAYVDDYVLRLVDAGGYFYGRVESGRHSLHSVFYEVDCNLRDLAFVGVEERIPRLHRQ